MTRLIGRFNKVLKRGLRTCHTAATASQCIYKKPPWNILFLGSDDFSLYSLKALFDEYISQSNLFSRLEVVTCSQLNPIWQFSTKHRLHIHKWPPDLTNTHYDLGLVVSFGHLIPEQIISKFPLGMLNVHASLLPRWRGASPITYTILHGDKEAGITIMRIKPKKFDTGDIVYQEKVVVAPNIELPQLHRQLGELGAECLVKTIRNLDERLAHARPQPQEGVTFAPKISPEFARINWSQYTAEYIHNLHRALMGVAPLRTTWNSVTVKLFDLSIWQGQRTNKTPGFVEYNRRDKVLLIQCADETWLCVKKVGVQGRKVMSAADFYNGFISKLDKNRMACFT